MKNNQLKESTLLTLLTTSFFVLCSSIFFSCGTEVGNGLSSPTGDDDPKAQNGKATGQAATNDSFNPEPGVIEDELPNSSDPTEVNPTDDTQDFNFDNWDYNLMFAPCASPFGNASLKNPISLYLSNSETKILEAKGAENTWTISSPLSFLFKANLGIETHQISLENIDGTTMQTNFQCGSISQENNVTLSGYPQTATKYLVDITKDSKVSRLTWYISSTPDANGIFQLLQVVINKEMQLTITLESRE